MTPNQITLLRIVLSLATLALVQGNLYTRIIAVILTSITLTLDALDGYVARRRNMATAQGAVLDILGDRIVENAYLIYFACAGQIPFWVPIVFLVRSSMTDFLRSLAMLEGKSAFGRNTMMETWWGKQLVASRWSRAFYGILKGVTFCYLGALMSLPHLTAYFDIRISAGWLRALTSISLGLVYILVALCLLRGLPVLWEGRKYLKQGAAYVTSA